MKKNTLFLLLSLSILLPSFRANDKATRTVDEKHAKLGFTITHLMVSDVEGSFKSFDATITTTADDFSDAVVEMTADVNSINTDNEMRDKDLKGPNYFDVEKFATLTFKSTSFKKVKDNTYKVTGNLTMHGVTKPVELDVLCRMGTNPRTQQPIAGFKISGTLNRKDFGIGMSAPGAVLSEEVTLLANAEFSKK